MRLFQPIILFLGRLAGGRLRDRAEINARHLASGDAWAQEASAHARLLTHKLGNGVPARTAVKTAVKTAVGSPAMPAPPVPGRAVGAVSGVGPVPVQSDGPGSVGDAVDPGVRDVAGVSDGAAAAAEAPGEAAADHNPLAKNHPLTHRPIRLLKPSPLVGNTDFR